MASDRKKILRAIQRESRYIADPHARRVFKKAAVETGIVESGLTNPHYGDADSQGWRQERASLYRNPTNINASVRRFRQEFEQHYSPGEKSYQVAADVQRPAAQYRGRYKDVAGQASQVLRGEMPANANTGYGTTTTTRTIPGVDNSAQRRDLKLAYLQNRHDPNALLELAAGLRGSQDTPDRQVTTTKRVRSTKQGGSADGGTGAKGGTADFEGHKVAAWIKPALVYARKHGWQGTVTSGYRSRAEQARIYNSGVRPAAKPGTSNHEGTQFPRGAIDVSNAEQLAQILAGTKYGRKLRYAGSKDPVHFSHPHGGGY